MTTPRKSKLLTPATNAVIKQFEKAVAANVKAGMQPDKAVREAYKKYPVMQTLQKEIERKSKDEIERGLQSEVSAKVAAKLTKQRWARDKLTLSERTTKGAKKVVSTVASVVGKAVRSGKTVTDLAREIFDGYGHGRKLPEQTIPQYLQAVSQVAKAAEMSAEKRRRWIRTFARQLDGLQDSNLRTAYKKLIQAAETFSEQAIERAIYVATQERTRYFAERIARTELARAYNAGAFERWRKDDDVIAMRWKRSGKHPTYDICDFFAEADLYGMGAGVFPVDKLPAFPAHPHCLCRLVPVFAGEQENETPDDTAAGVDKRAQEFIRGLPTHHAERILGVKGLREWKAGRARWQDLLQGDLTRTMSGQPGLKELLTGTKSKKKAAGPGGTKTAENGIIAIQDSAVTEPPSTDADWESMKRFATPVGCRAYFDESYSTWVSGLAQDQVNAIDSYTGDGYKEINTYLRGKANLSVTGAERVRNQIKAIDSALAQFELKDYVRLYRGRGMRVPITKEMIGTVFDDDAAYQSSSLLRETAEDFAKQKKNPHVYEICMPPGRGRGAYVTPMSRYKGEQEFLIARGTKYKIIDVKTDGEFTRVKLEVIADV